MIRSQVKKITKILCHENLELYVMAGMKFLSSKNFQLYGNMHCLCGAISTLASTLTCLHSFIGFLSIVFIKQVQPMTTYVLHVCVLSCFNMRQSMHKKI